MSFFLLVLLSLAVARLTRFIESDSLIDGTRNKLKRFLLWPREGARGFLAAKGLKLIDCTWCVSIWCSIAVVLVVDWATSYSLPLPVLWVPATSMLAVSFVEYNDGVKQVIVGKREDFTRQEVPTED